MFCLPPDCGSGSSLRFCSGGAGSWEVCVGVRVVQSQAREYFLYQFLTTAIKTFSKYQFEVVASLLLQLRSELLFARFLCLDLEIYFREHEDQQGQ